MKRTLLFLTVSLFATGVYSQTSSPANTPAPTGMPGAPAPVAVRTAENKVDVKEEVTTPRKDLATPAQTGTGNEMEPARTAPDLPKQPATTSKETSGSPQ